MKVKRIPQLYSAVSLLVAMLFFACPPEEDDYVAPWPQDVIENNDYDESVPAGPLEAKANSLDEWNAQWHQPYYGAQLDRLLFTDTDYDEVAYHLDAGDSTMHTGIYLASQAFRYHVTKSPEARENAKRAARVLSGHLHVTGKRGYIARLRAPYPEFFRTYTSETCDDADRCHVVSEGEYAGDFWLGHTSRDMYFGWMFGMSIAYDLIDDEDTKAMIRADMLEVVTELIANNWTITPSDNDPYNNPQFAPLDKVAFSVQAYHVSGDSRVLAALKEGLMNWQREIYNLFEVNRIFPFNRYGAYYPNHLAHLNHYSLLRLAKFYFSDDDYSWFVRFFNESIHTYSRLAHTPFLNVVYMSQGGWERSDNDPYIHQLLQDFGDLSGAPAAYTRRPGPEPGSYTIDPVSQNANSFYEAINQIQIPELQEALSHGLRFQLQAEEAFPIPLQCESPHYQANPNPFQICETVNANLSETWVESGQTYLVPYWMARYYGFITKDHGLEAAAFAETATAGDAGGVNGKGKKPKKPKKKGKKKKKKK